RDLKPDNIFLTHDDEGGQVVKVVDFGIAKLRESSNTMTGTVLGTPAYMSYEQASGMRSDELDARSDIYSVGVVVYEMLTGRLPFHSDTPIGYLRKHLMEEPPPFRAVAQGLSVPPAVENTVIKALVKDREQRYASVLDFSRELTKAALPSPTVEAPVAIPPTRIVPPPTVRENAAPMPLPASTQANADIAVQASPPSLPQKIAETQVARQHRSKPVGAASRPPAVSEPLQFRRTSKRPGKMKFVAIGIVGLILFVAGVWF